MIGKVLGSEERAQSAAYYDELLSPYSWTGKGDITVWVEEESVTNPQHEETKNLNNGGGKCAL